MNSDVIEMKRPQKVVTEFLDTVTEDELLAALDAVDTQQDIPSRSPRPFDAGAVDPAAKGFETNSRLTIIKMFEQAPEFGQPFTFCVKRYAGEAYVQAMRTTLSKARKLAKDQNYDTGPAFKMIVVDIQTREGMDVVTVTRIAKGEKHLLKLGALVKMMGGQVSDIAEDDEDDN